MAIQPKEGVYVAFKVGRCLLPNLLKRRGMTQQDLADKLQMPRSQISDYRTNRRVMSLETAKAIAKALDCHIDDLYEWIEVKPSEKKRSR